MEELLKLIDKYEQKTGLSCVELRLFSDGSGTICEFGNELFMFDNIEQLMVYIDMSTNNNFKRK